MNVILFVGFFLSYINILNYSIPLGVCFLFSAILLNICIYFIYHKFFMNQKFENQQEKELLFHSCLKKKKSKEKYDEKECSICYEESSTKKLYELNCSCRDKFYHQECLKQWLYKAGSCPFCRKKMYDNLK
jgi:hypothetical protein